MTYPLLTSVGFNDGLKMAPIEVKQILSFCQTRMHVTDTVHCLHIYIRSACIVLRVFMTRKQAAYVYRKTL